MNRRVASALLGLWLVAAPGRAEAKEPQPEPSLRSLTAIASGREVIVELSNPTDVPVRGFVRSQRDESGLRDHQILIASRPVTLPPHSEARVQLLREPGWSNYEALVDERGQELARSTVSAGRYNGNQLIDLSANPALAALASLGSSSQTVALPDRTRDGRLLRPTHLGGYFGTAAVYLTHSALAEFDQDEQIALVDYLASGGTLMLDPGSEPRLATPLLRALLGGAVNREEQPLAKYTAALLGAARAHEPADPYAAETEETLAPSASAAAAITPPTGTIGARYVGGNASDDAYGTTFPYALGRVVVLPFSVGADASDAWQLRWLEDLVRDSDSLRAQIAPLPHPDARVGHGAALAPSSALQTLIALTCVVLLIYALALGMLLYRSALTHNRFGLLRGLLPLAGGFTVLLATAGYLTRRSQEGVRSVSMWQSGAGAKLLTRQRIEGHYQSSWVESGARAARALLSAPQGFPVQLRDGLQFVSSPTTLPWSVAVLTETLVVESEQHLDVQCEISRCTVRNHTQSELTHVLVGLPNGRVVHLPRLAVDATASSSDGLDITDEAQAHDSVASLLTTTGSSYHVLNGQERLDATQGYEALHALLSEQHQNLAAPGVPVVLAQLPHSGEALDGMHELGRNAGRYLLVIGTGTAAGEQP